MLVDHVRELALAAVAEEIVVRVLLVQLRLRLLHLHLPRSQKLFDTNLYEIGVHIISRYI